MIAIMAILVAVLAPQFLKYVERSRNSADIANAKEITNAISAYAADVQSEYTFPEDAKYTIEVVAKTSSGTDTLIVTDSAKKDTTNYSAPIEDALFQAGLVSTAATKKDEVKYSSLYCKSKQTWTAYTITVEVKSGGAITFTYSATGDSKSVFANSFQGGS